jgi:hypothetical protein
MLGQQEELIKKAEAEKINKEDARSKASTEPQDKNKQNEDSASKATPEIAGNGKTGWCCCCKEEKNKQDPNTKKDPAANPEMPGKAGEKEKAGETNKAVGADQNELKPIGEQGGYCGCCKEPKRIRVNPKTNRVAATIENILKIKQYLLQAYNSRPLKTADLMIYKDFSLEFQLKFIECNYLNSKVQSPNRS